MTVEVPRPLDPAKATARELLERLLPDHEGWGHSLATADWDIKGDLLSVHCSCGKVARFSWPAVAARAGGDAPAWRARLRQLGRMDRSEA